MSGGNVREEELNEITDNGESSLWTEPAVLSLFAWLVVEITLTLGSYHQVIRNAPAFQPKLEQAKNVITQAALTSCAISFLVVAVGGLLGVSLTTQDLNPNTVIVFRGIALILASIVFLVISMRVGRRWLGINYRFTVRGRENDAWEVKFFTLKALRFNVNWSCSMAVMSIFFPLLMFFCGESVGRLYASVFLGLGIGAVCIGLFFIDTSRMVNKRWRLVVAGLLALGLSILSAFAFATGCYYIHVVWGGRDTSEYSYDLLAGVAWIGWLLLCLLIHVVKYRGVKTKIDDDRRKSIKSMTPEEMAKVRTELEGDVHDLELNEEEEDQEAKDDGAAVETFPDEEQPKEPLSGETNVGGSNETAQFASSAAVETSPRLPTEEPQSNITGDGKSKSIESVSFNEEGVDVEPPSSTEESDDKAPPPSSEEEPSTMLVGETSMDLTTTSSAKRRRIPSMKYWRSKKNLGSLHSKPMPSDNHENYDALYAAVATAIEEEEKTTRWQLFRSKLTCCVCSTNKGEIPLWQVFWRDVRMTITILIHLLCFFLVVVCIGASKQGRVTRERYPITNEAIYGAGIDNGPVCAMDDIALAENGDIRTFPDRAAAHVANYTILHCGACAACSTWFDLEQEYCTRNNLAEQSQKCASKALFSLQNSLECTQNIFPGEACAKCWVDDYKCTAKYCVFLGMQALLINALLNFEVAEGVITPANCEEANCEGPDFGGAERYPFNGYWGGFVKCSGATRRRMNVQSSIRRPASDMCSITDVDYAELFGPCG